MGSRVEVHECRVCEGSSLVLANGLCVGCHDRKVKAAALVRAMTKANEIQESRSFRVVPF